MGLSAKNQSVGIGTKYRMHELEAALLNPQLATLAEQTRMRNKMPPISPSGSRKFRESYRSCMKGSPRGLLHLVRYQKEHFNDAPKEKFLALRAERSRSDDVLTN